MCTCVYMYTNLWSHSPPKAPNQSSHSATKDVLMTTRMCMGVYMYWYSTMYMTSYTCSYMCSSNFPDGCPSVLQYLDHHSSRQKIACHGLCLPTQFLTVSPSSYNYAEFFLATDRLFVVNRTIIGCLCRSGFVYYLRLNAPSILIWFYSSFRLLIMDCKLTCTGYPIVIAQLVGPMHLVSR